MTVDAGDEPAVRRLARSPAVVAIVHVGREIDAGAATLLEACIALEAALGVLALRDPIRGSRTDAATPRTVKRVVLDVDA
jgi:hypothetical protein